MDAGKPLGAFLLLFGLGSYLAAVSGAMFAEATPPGDVGATSTLAMFLLFAVLAFLVGRPAPRGV